HVRLILRLQEVDRQAAPDCASLQVSDRADRAQSAGVRLRFRLRAAAARPPTRDSRKRVPHWFGVSAGSGHNPKPMRSRRARAEFPAQSTSMETAPAPPRTRTRAD